MEVDFTLTHYCTMAHLAGLWDPGSINRVSGTARTGTSYSLHTQELVHLPEFHPLVFTLTAAQLTTDEVLQNEGKRRSERLM